MKDDSQKRPMGCAGVGQRIYHYQAGELSPAERELVRGHLSDCPDCARRLEIEERFLHTLKSRMPRAQATPELRERVRSVLAHERSSRRPAGFERPAWLQQDLIRAASYIVAASNIRRRPGHDALACASKL